MNKYHTVLYISFEISQCNWYKGLIPTEVNQKENKVWRLWRYLVNCWGCASM